MIFNKDNQINYIIKKELKRQREKIELIASENFTSPEIIQTQGSILTNKYAEGYPGKRYYGGCKFIDKIENLAINRLKKLFSCKYANVQAHSGSQANQAVFTALLKPGDTFLSMSLKAGGHLTHGSLVNQSGKWFNPIHYEVHPKNHLIDYNQIEKLAKKHKPKLIIAGGSAYPRSINFSYFKDIANQIGAYLMVDMAHFAGLVAGKVFNTPIPYADIITSTTHKTLRGPRGGIILTNDTEIAKKINSAIFPGIQGGPLMHIIAAKAIAFKEALNVSFQIYAKNTIKNAKMLSENLQSAGINILTGGTDSHLIMINLSSLAINGKEVEYYMEQAGITCNKNSIPFDPLPPVKTSGIRIGTAAMTTRGFQEKEFIQIAKWITEIIRSIKEDNTKTTLQKIRKEVYFLCKEFLLYPHLKF